MGQDRPYHSPMADIAAWPEVRRTGILLADGRALSYYDRPPAPERTRSDSRPREALAAATQGRRDPLTGEWTLVAAHRQNRTYHPADDACPLCPSSPGRPTEIPESDYQVVVFDNRFPAMRDPGHCEVVCFGPQHDLRVADLHAERVLLIVQAWADRVRHLRDRGLVSCLVFENRGAEIGVTLSHPHGQIYAYPFLAPRDRVILEQAAQHQARTGRLLALDALEEELADGRRILAVTDHWAAYVPYAARWPFEILLTPRRPTRDLAALDAAQARDFASLYPLLLAAMDRVLGVAMPYVSAWRQAPLTADEALGAHLALNILGMRRAPDKLKHPAGSETAAGVWINDLLPERSAAMLREAMAASP